VGALSFVEPKCPGERVQYALGHPVQIAALEAGVVIDADAGEQRDLFSAQPGNASIAAIGRQTRSVRAELGPARGQEVADLIPVVHTPDVTGDRGSVGGAASTCIDGDGMWDGVQRGARR
jgi:hypothetical protein